MLQKKIVAKIPDLFQECLPVYRHDDLDLFFEIIPHKVLDIYV